MATAGPTGSANRPAPATAATVALVLSATVDFVNLGGYLSVPRSRPASSGSGSPSAGRRWAAPLAIVVAVITVLLGGVGILWVGSTTGKAVGAAGALLGLAVIALVAPRVARRAAA